MVTRHWSVLLDHIALQLDREGMKGRENGERGGGGDDYSRKAINRGTAIIPRNTVHEASLSPAGRDTDSKIPANNFHQTNHSANKLFIYPTALEQSSWTRLQQSHIAWIVMIMELKSLANIKRHDFAILLSYPRVGPVSRNVTAPTMFWNVAFQSEVFRFSTDPLIFCHGGQATKTLCFESRGTKIQTFSLHFYMEFIIVVFTALELSCVEWNSLRNIWRINI